MIQNLDFVLKEKASDFFASGHQLVFNFLNSHDLYFFKKDSLFRETFTDKNINFIDGFVISLFLSIKYCKSAGRLSGPDFTKDFFGSGEAKNKSHFFIGLDEKDLESLAGKFPYLDKDKIYSYNPPYIKGSLFDKKELDKITTKINSKRPDFVWVGLGCPKQNFLSHALREKINAKIIFNVGAALDFLLDKKRRAPRKIRILGIEWLYRFVTDFKHSRYKVWRSFISILYLNRIRLK